MPPASEVTLLLTAWTSGDAGALDRLVPLLYDDLHRIAERQFHRERPNHTLQPTALVNEAFLALVDQQSVPWQGRAHFLGVAARIMRRILVDHARAHGAEKRGGGATRLALDDAELGGPTPVRELVALDDALKELERIDGRKSQIVELRYFGGLSIEETAAVRHMINHLVQERGLRRDEAYVLCSVAVDLKLSQVVNAPHWVVSAFLPLCLFAG